MRLTSEGGERTVLELEHVAVVPEGFWGQFGPGAVGVGWSLAFLGLGRYLAGGGMSKEEGEEDVKVTTAATIAFYTGADSAEGQS